MSLKVKTVQTFKKMSNLEDNMKQQMVQISKKEYEELLEEVGILRNPEMMEAIRESDEAKKKGVKTWKLKTYSQIRLRKYINHF